MATVADEIRDLLNYNDVNDHVCVVVWTVEDIQKQGKEIGMRVSKHKAEEILESMRRHHDAEIGINWDVISEHIRAAFD